MYAFLKIVGKRCERCGTFEGCSRGDLAMIPRLRAAKGAALRLDDDWSETKTRTAEARRQ